MQEPKAMNPTEWGLLVLLSVLWGGAYFCVGVAGAERGPADRRSRTEQDRPCRQGCRSGVDGLGSAVSRANSVLHPTGAPRP